MWNNRIKIKKTKFFFGIQLKLEKRQKSNVEWVISLSIKLEYIAIFEFKSTWTVNSK